MTPLEALASLVPPRLSRSWCPEQECADGGECESCQSAREAHAALAAVRALVEAALAWRAEIVADPYSPPPTYDLMLAVDAFNNWRPGAGAETGEGVTG